MKHITSLIIGVSFLFAGFAAPGAGGTETTGGTETIGGITKAAAVKKFSRIVVGYHRHLTKESPAEVACERATPNSFDCAGRWKATAIKKGSSVPTRFTYGAEGGVSVDSDATRGWAQMTRWEITGGVKRGPIHGALLRRIWDD